MLLTALLLSTLALQSQDVRPDSAHKNKFKGGAGFFHCFPAGSNGISMWLEYSRGLKSGFDIDIKFQYSHANMRLGSYWGPWEGKFKPDLFYVVDISFSRKISLSARQYITPGLGIMIQKGYSWLPPFEIINGNHIVFRENFGDVSEDLGFSFKLDYYYSLTETISVGLRVQSAYLWPMWVESIVVTPVISLNF